ncbi:MAG: HAD family phosphatase [Bacteroides sp.]|nr:HAD family phosphatase [Bacteroides sp.]
MKPVKNIIFDLGGVVIDLARHRAISSLQALGMEEAAVLLDEYEQKGPFLKLETGEFSSADLYDTILPMCAPGTTTRDIRDAFEQFLVDLPVERLHLIEALRNKGYKVFVLSNTNPIMYNHWIENAFRKDGKTINDYFDGIVASFQERTCKPDPQIFRNLVERYHLNPEETLMLDDSAANCRAAESIGLNAIRVEKDGENSITAIGARLLESEVEK